MKHVIVCLFALGAVSACAVAPTTEARPEVDVTEAEDGQIRPEPRPNDLDVTATPVPSGATTVEEFDTTSAQERNDAVAEAETAGGDAALGSTVASLGSPTEPGFWLKTPLVSKPTKGKVTYPGSGKSVAVDLIPIDGPKTAGSRMSLAAMRLIEAPLTGLPEVEVFRVSG